jgi:hypothetical protein
VPGGTGRRGPGAGQKTLDRQTLKTATSACWNGKMERGKVASAAASGAVRNLGASHGPELQKNQAVSKVY